MTDHTAKPAETGTFPRIWFSRIAQTTEVHVRLDFVSPNRDVQARLACLSLYQRWEAWSNDCAPTRLFFKEKGGKIPASCKDAFTIFDGLIVISRKFRDVLAGFELGRTRLIELPVYQSDGETPADIAPHYILNVTETKPCFVPEESENVRRYIVPGETEPRPGAPWKSVYSRDRPAVRASAAEGVDLWGEPVLRQRLFFSDRLKQAIDAAGITRKGLDLTAAKVVA
ncbi:MAG TPA: DUF1629 domain-containing protein [Thermohalobaculum sp.]|nr:DUF1629 domain-containing protein [Thermohalobaculum sp.]